MALVNKDSNVKVASKHQLSANEVKWLLQKIAAMNFVGAEVQICYEVVVKLQQQYEEIKD